MPQGDRTGPAGQGPMTGRGMGFCAGNDRPGFMEPGIGFRGGGRFRAFNRGGFGRGFRFRQRIFQQPVIAQEPVELTKEQEKKLLEAEKKEIEAEKADIEKRLKELK